MNLNTLNFLSSEALHYLAINCSDNLLNDFSILEFWLTK